MSGGMDIHYVAVGSIIIDDIVDGQGRSNMGMLGGGGSHAVSGMRVWSENTALVTIIGEDFPESAWRQLSALTDTRGIITRPIPQPRFWLLLENDGTRNEVPRTDFGVFQKTIYRLEEFPGTLAGARALYLQTPTTNLAEAWIDHLRAINPEIIVLWEPWEIYYKPENLSGFRQVAPLFDIVSPQTVELGRMIGETEPHKQAEILFDCGVNCLALRLGSAGSLVGTAAGCHHLPAAPAKVIDETGAGNAYCGGFLVGYTESGGDPLAAGRYGAISATFALAQVGVAPLRGNIRVKAEARLQKAFTRYAQ